uniref:retinol-binding protein 2-like n=1 Tax=Myxine glutinosa TaxID=7769 RepID=UPI00358FE506
MAVDFSGTYDFVSGENFDGYMKILGIDYPTRKIGNLLKPQKVVTQEGDKFCFKTLSSFRNYDLSFTVGQEFDEHTKGLDGRHLKSTVRWEGERMVCTQIGEKKDRSWSHWLEGDLLHLEMACEGQVCKQIFKKRN